ncbi:MAG: DNA polymerase III subunit delta [Bacteroides sp.]|nr:DNA polymerase III subunit delta [Bacteroides sp.]
MAKKETKSYRDIIRDIRKRNCAPIYLLMGEEAYYIDLIIDNFEKYFIDDQDKDFDFNVFFGNDADVDYIIGAARQFPVMSEKKLVILKEAQSMHMAKNQLEKFAPYAAKPNPDTVFVIAYKGEPLKATSKLVKNINESEGVVFNSIVPRDYQLLPLIKDYCQQKKVSIDDKAANMLVEFIGTPLSKLFGEINKLILIKGAGEIRIMPEDVEKNIGASKDFNNFELVNALCEKNYPKAIKIIKFFAANPTKNPSNVTTGVMFNFFSNLVIAHYMTDKSDAALRDQFGFRNPVQFSDMRTALRNYSAGQAVKAIRILRDFDIKSKGIGSSMKEHDLLAETVFKLFT